MRDTQVGGDLEMEAAGFSGRVFCLNYLCAYMLRISGVAQDKQSVQTGGKNYPLLSADLRQHTEGFIFFSQICTYPLSDTVSKHLCKAAVCAL